MPKNLNDVKTMIQRLIDAEVVNLDLATADLIANLEDETDLVGAKPMAIAWGCYALVTDCGGAAAMAGELAPDEPGAPPSGPTKKGHKRVIK